MWIVANQGARRNLKSSQLAMIAEGLATLSRGANQHTAAAVSSQSQIAERFGISVDSIQRAKKIRSSSSCPELIAAAEAGLISVEDGAKNAHVAPDELKEAVEMVNAGKPEAFYELVNAMCPGSKVEYFAREQRPGYAVYGNDTGKFTEAAA